MSLPGDPTNISTMLAVIEAARHAGVPVLMWGAPGVGKSSIVAALAKHRECAFETVIGSQSEPSDFGGLPVVRESGVTMEAHDWARRLAAHENGGLLFLDELTTATPAVQAAMLRVVNDRVVGNQVLGDQVQVIAAANPPEQSAGGWDLTAPMANRFCHVDLIPAPLDWVSGLISGFPMVAPEPLNTLTPQSRKAAEALVAGFIRKRTDLMHVYPADATSSGKAWPSPRTWTHLAGMLAQLTTDEAALMAANGLVGEGAAAEFLTWRAEANLPDPADLIADPSTADWDDLAAAPDRAWAALSSVVAHVAAAPTHELWRSGWGPLAEACDHGLSDVAAACAVSHMRARPGSARPPASARKFTDALKAAGLAA